MRTEVEFLQAGIVRQKVQRTFFYDVINYQHSCIPILYRDYSRTD
jgi:hypothetical protein